MFRTPVDDSSASAAFYQAQYTEGATTRLPEPEALPALISGGWDATPHSYGRYAMTLKALGLAAGAKVFDFGCSWGYGSRQLIDAGFDVLSYEISHPRGAYGAKHLGIRLVEDFDLWAESAPDSMDAFFSAHVLEHVPSPSRVIAQARRVLKPGGLFLAFVPNGSAASRGANPAWSSLWGENHPNFLDDAYLNAAASDRPRLFGAYALPSVVESEWLKSAALPAAHYLNDLRGDELMFAFRLAGNHSK